MCTQLHSKSNNNNNKNKINTIVYIYAHFAITIKQVMYPYTTSQQQFNAVLLKILNYNLVCFYMDGLVTIHKSVNQ
jgi:hypothetical protein